MKGLICVVCLLSVPLTARAVASYAKAICERRPIHTHAVKTPGDNAFRIKVEGTSVTDKYRPGETYTVVLNGSSPDQRLLGFMLVAVKKGAKFENETVGKFDTTTYHGRVRNLIDEKICDHDVMSHHYLMEKKGVRMTWIAPPSGSECVEMRATVIEYSDIWYKDEGGLTKILCEEMSQQDSGDTVAADSPSLVHDQECCACGHAKYFLKFQGLWSRQTHPKDFPSGDRAYLLHWSNIIGATHSNDYRIWDYGEFSSSAVKEVCEYGSSLSLEDDMKGHSRKIRTVVKTDSLWGPDKIGKSVEAVFTVNQKKHLLSLVTMIGPSPDWCLGISAQDLCQKNCTWADELTIDLYPWDAGTDSGITYDSHNIETNPPESIQRITNTFPNNPKSPFYGPDSVKPLGRLFIKKSYEACTNDHGETDSEELSPSTEELVSQMKRKMMMKKKMQMEKCATSQWSEWSECSNPCGTGSRERRRMLKNPGILPSMCRLDLNEIETCIESSSCMQGRRKKKQDSFSFRHAKEQDPNDMCAVTAWSDWSPCSQTCGLGMKERWRIFLQKSHKNDDCGVHLQEKDLCRGTIPDCDMAMKLKNFTAICSEPAEPGPCRGEFERWFYNVTMQKCQKFEYGGCRGNENKFDKQDECVELCAKHMAEVHHKQQVMLKQEMMLKQQMLKQQMMEKQKMMARQQLGEASLSLANMDLATLKMKKKMMAGQNLKLEKEFEAEIKKRRKEKRMMRKKQKMERRRRRHRKTHRRHQNDGPRRHCMVTPWSDWTECNVSCGKGTIMKTRMIKVQPENGGRKCPRKLVKKRKCKQQKKCPINCSMGNWGEWQDCTKTCGERSVQIRRRKLIQRPKHGGLACPAKREKRFCSVPMCPNEDV